MTRGKLKSLGVDPDGGRFAATTIPYNPDTLKALVAGGKLV
jgi:hypothetical protein